MTGMTQKTKDRLTKLISILSDAGRPLGVIEIIDLFDDATITNGVVWWLLSHEMANGVIFKKAGSVLRGERKIPGKKNMYFLSEYGHQEDVAKAQQFKINLYITFFKMTKDRTKHPWDT